MTSGIGVSPEAAIYSEKLLRAPDEFVQFIACKAQGTFTSADETSDLGKLFLCLALLVILWEVSSYRHLQIETRNASCFDAKPSPESIQPSHCPDP